MAILHRKNGVGLGRNRAGLTTVGYKVLRMSDNAVLTAFTKVGVQESVSVPGNYYVPAGISVPDNTPVTIAWSYDNGATFYREEQFDPATDDVPTASEIAAIFRASSAGIAFTAVGVDLTIRRGDTWIQAFTELGDIQGFEKLWFTLKERGSLTDSASTVQIEEGDGLLFLNGRPASDSSLGLLEVSDAASGDLAITISQEATKLLSKSQANLYYDIQVRGADGRVTTLAEGRLAILEDVTRTT